MEVGGNGKAFFWKAVEKATNNGMCYYWTIIASYDNFALITVISLNSRRVIMSERFYLYNDLVDTKTRFVSFVHENTRFDLAIIQSDRYYGKKLVLDIQGNRFAIIGQDDLEEEGYLEHVFQLSEEDAEELRSFLYEIV